jgi:hypothetical protein
MYRIAQEVGRLVEIAIGTPVSIAEVERGGSDHDRVVDGVGRPWYLDTGE